jgi:hypothetical protein
MASKDAKDLEQCDHVSYDYGNGPMNWTVASVTVLPPGGIDEVALLLSSETEGERLASAVKHADQFEVPAW